MVPPFFPKNSRPCPGVTRVPPGPRVVHDSILYLVATVRPRYALLIFTPLCRNLINSLTA